MKNRRIITFLALEFGDLQYSIRDSP